jgi:predicted small secreted protein
MTFFLRDLAIFAALQVEIAQDTNAVCETALPKWNPWRRPRLLQWSIQRRTQMQKKHLAAIVILPLAMLAACNTTEGVGKDMQSAGKEISKSADENK